MVQRRAWTEWMRRDVLQAGVEVMLQIWTVRRNVLQAGAEVWMQSWTFAWGLARGQKHGRSDSAHIPGLVSLLEVASYVPQARCWGQFG